MDTLLFQHGQSIDEIKNRLNCIENGVGDFSTSNDGVPGSGSVSVSVSTKSELMSDPEFVNGIVDNIMTNSNLAEMIEQIDVVQSENRELRELIYAQQKTMNEMNIMLLKLFSQSVVVAAQAAHVVEAAPKPVAAPNPVAEEDAEEDAAPNPVAEAAPNPVAEAEEDAEEEAPNPVVEADADEENVVEEADA